MARLNCWGNATWRAIVGAVAALCVVSCVDNDFRLDKVSTEITVGGDEMVVPLGSLERQTLGAIFGSDLEFLSQGENGLYSLDFSSYGDDVNKWEKIAIDGVSVPTISGLSPEKQTISFSTGELPRSIKVSEIKVQENIEYPTIGTLIDIDPINVSHTMTLDFGNLPLSGAGELSDMVLQYLPADKRQLVYSYQGHTYFNALLDIPDMVEKLDYVLFGDATHPHGAPFDIELNLNGLAGINGGTTIDLDFIFPNGYYLRDSNGRDLDVHNHLITTVTIPEKKGVVALHLFLHKIDYSDEAYQQGDHKIQIEDHIEYHIDMKTSLTAGQYNLNSPAHFSMKAEPIYKDVEIRVNHLEIPSIEAPIAYTFDGLPENVNINRIAFAEAPISLKIGGLEWFDADVYVKMNFPKCFVFDAKTAPSTFDASENSIVASIQQLHDGVTLNLAAIDCTSSECRRENGQLCVDTKIVTAIDTHLLDHTEIMLSHLMPATSPIKLTTTIAGATFVLDIDKTDVQFGSEQIFNFDLSEQLPTISQKVELPEQIVGVDRLTVCKAGTKEPVSVQMRLAVPKGAAFPVDNVNLNFSINLGKMLRPTQRMFDEGVITTTLNGDYILLVDEGWCPNSAAFERVIEIEALENLPEISADGKMTISQSFPVTGSVTIPNGQDVNLSSANAAIEVDITIDDIEVSSFTGRVGVNAVPDNLPVIELGDIADLGLDINSLKINPVVRFILKDNPIGVPFKANIKLQPYAASGAAMEAIVIPEIVVASDGRSEIVLSTAANREVYQDKPGVSFVCVDALMGLLEGDIPAKVALDVSVATDSTEQCTLDLAAVSKGINVEYQYDVHIPLAFDGAFDLSFAQRLQKLNSMFSGISDFDASIGEVAIVADFATTIPFSMVLSAELLDVDGNKIVDDLAFNVENGTIYGYTSDYGEKRTSQLVFNFALNDGSLANLRRVDGLDFKIMLCNTDTLVSRLSAEQFIEAKFYLRLRGGVTIDLGKLLN